MTASRGQRDNTADAESVRERSPEERAAWVLRRACNGWRRDRQCRTGNRVLDQPHPGCVRAQEEHDHFLNTARPDMERS